MLLHTGIDRAKLGVHNVPLVLIFFFSPQAEYF